MTRTKANIGYFDTILNTFGYNSKDEGRLVRSIIRGKALLKTVLESTGKGKRQAEIEVDRRC